MTTASDPGIDSITASLRQAVEHLELANRAIYGDRREVLDLYDILGALTTLVGRLPQMIEYLRSMSAPRMLISMTMMTDRPIPPRHLILPRAASMLH